MLVIGLDAAADLKNFGYAVGRYSGQRVNLIDSGTLDDRAYIKSLLVDRIGVYEKALIAVDAPLGWPTALGESLADHVAGNSFSTLPNSLFRRETDRVVRQLTGKQSLDVGADRIARAAWSALSVLGSIREQLAEPVPLAWEPDFRDRYGIIEVYPAATLNAWAAPSSGYKKVEQVGVREKIAEHFATEVPWLQTLVNRKADVFDAGLCIVAAIDFLCGRTAGPTNKLEAQREGWIWVKTPTGRIANRELVTKGFRETANE